MGQSVEGYGRRFGSAYGQHLIGSTVSNAIAFRRDAGTRQRGTGLCSTEPGSSDSPLMLILFDHGTPRGISRALQGHIVKEARAQGGTH